MDKKFGFQIVLLIIVSLAGVFFYKSNYSTSTSTPQVPFLPQTVKFNTVVINGAEIKAEVADTPQKRGKGLGGRDKLNENEGMIFIFDRDDKYSFWMKGMSFPLDFVWIKEDTVLQITENAPIFEPNQSTENIPPIYSSKVEINKVLELNAGTVKRLNIKAGDKIVIK